jgi:hypothetical protein
LTFKFPYRRPSFSEEKEAKRLLLRAWGDGAPTAHDPKSRSFLARAGRQRFFFKKEPLG